MSLCYLLIVLSSGVNITEATYSSIL